VEANPLTIDSAIYDHRGYAVRGYFASCWIMEGEAFGGPVFCLRFHAFEGIPKKDDATRPAFRVLDLSRVIRKAEVYYWTA
jgi:hypothetical protein